MDGQNFQPRLLESNISSESQVKNCVGMMLKYFQSFPSLEGTFKAEIVDCLLNDQL